MWLRKFLTYFISTFRKFGVDVIKKKKFPLLYVIHWFGVKVFNLCYFRHLLVLLKPKKKERQNLNFSSLAIRLSKNNHFCCCCFQMANALCQSPTLRLTLVWGISSCVKDFFTRPGNLVMYKNDKSTQTPACTHRKMHIHLFSYICGFLD